MDTTTLIVGIVLGIYAIVSGTLEFFERMGFPTPLQKRRDEKNKRIVIDTLQEAGLLSHRAHIRQIGDLIFFRRSVPTSSPNEMLDDIVTKYTRKVVGIEVGLFEQTHVHYFVDFPNALADPEDGKILTRILCREIMNTMSSFSEEPFYFDSIAVSKSGSTAMALRVALEFQKPWVFVDLRGGTIASDTIEGKVSPGDQVIIIHDILASGRLIDLMSQELKKRQAKVKHVFVLLERTDRKLSGQLIPSELLPKCGLTLHTLGTINDQQLKDRLEKNSSDSGLKA